MKLTLLFFSIILVGIIPFAYGAIHPEPAVYIVNVSDSFPNTSLFTDVGGQIIIVWGIENRGNVPLENVTITSTIESGLTFDRVKTGNCTFDEPTRKVTCVAAALLEPFQGIIRHETIFTVDSFPLGGSFSNNATVCGTYQGVQHCDEDGSFNQINPVEPIPEPIPTIQTVNVTALGERLVTLENRVTTLENIPLPTTGPQGEQGIQGPIGLTGQQGERGLTGEPGSIIDLTLIENRLSIIEQWIIDFTTAWRNLFG